MSWLTSLSARYSRNIHFGTIIVLSISLALGGVSLTTAVHDVAYTIFYYPFFKIRSNVEELLIVSEKQRSLRESLVESAVEISLLRNALKENERFRVMLGFEPPPSYSLLPAKVVSTSGGKLPILATVNKGFDSGVEENQTVINQHGLLGKVNMVGPISSVVELLTSPANRVAIRVTSTRDMGILKFQQKKGLILEHIPVQSEIKAGDTIVTSGLGGIYAGGFLIGTVKSVERVKDNPFCEIVIESAANFNSIEELFMLKKNLQ